MKQVDLHAKHREFAPYESHHITCRKPLDDIFANMKDHQQRAANKQLKEKKATKDMKVIVDDIDDDVKDVVEKPKKVMIRLLVLF